MSKAAVDQTFETVSEVNSSLLLHLRANAGDRKRREFTPGWESSLGGGHGNPLRYSFLDNPMDRGAWQAIQFKGSQRRHD